MTTDTREALAHKLADHIEHRLRTWRQQQMNRSGDRLALDDFMGEDSIADLVDFVCDEYALDAALATQPAQPVATVTECEACFTPDVCQLRGTCDHYSAQKLRVATQPAQPSAQGEAVAHPSHLTVREWMPVNEALRLADVWSAGDLDNCGQWRAAIKVLADEVRALASAPAAPAQAVPQETWPIERAADMLTAYAEMVKWTGSYAQEFYVPEIEHVVSELRDIAPKAAQPQEKT